MSKTPPTPSRAPGSRLLKLSSVEVLPRHLVGAVIDVDSDGYVGLVRAQGRRLVDQVSRAQGNQEKPVYLLIVDHETIADDVVGVPTMVEHPDAVRIDWFNKGRSAKLNFAKLLTLKKITIPEGTRMVIDLYEEYDPEYGSCVGMKLMGAKFVAKKKGVARKKKTEGTSSAMPAITQPAPASTTGN